MAAASSPSPHAREFTEAGWTLRTSKSSIPKTDEVDALQAELTFAPPEMTFLSSHLELHHPRSSFTYAFRAKPALLEVDRTGGEGLRVAYAESWARTRETSPSSHILPMKPWDWTYTTTHPGASSHAFRPAPLGHPGIPLARLASRDEPILFYEDVQLFEDELGDNGTVSLNVRVRVMPSGVFALQRFFLRVDDVLFRIFDVRLYHAFGADEVIRELSGWEAPWADVKARLPTPDLAPLTDPNFVHSVLVSLAPPNHPAVAAVRPPSHSPSSTASPLARPAPSSPVPAPADPSSNILPPLTRTRAHRAPRPHPAGAVGLPGSPASVLVPAVGALKLEELPSAAVSPSPGEQPPTRRQGAGTGWNAVGRRLEVARLSEGPVVAEEGRAGGGPDALGAVDRRLEELRLGDAVGQ